MKKFYLIAFFFLFKTLSVDAQFVQQGTKLVGTGAGFVGAMLQGWSVAISGDGNTMIVGGIHDFNTVFNCGAVWVYIKQGNNWVQQGNKLIPNDNIGGAYFGASVSLSYDGSTAIIGGDNDNAGNGAAWIFTRKNNIWSQKQKLTMLDPTGNQQHFGVSVSITADGKAAVIGATNDNSHYGAACIFMESNGVWIQQGPKLIPINNNYSNPYFGISVSISASGNTVVIGNQTPDPNIIIGPVVFTNQNGVWLQSGAPLQVSDNLVNLKVAASVSISGDGNTIITSGIEGDVNESSATWIFTLSGGIWKQQGPKLVPNSYIGVTTAFGCSVSLSYDGNIAVIGNYRDNGNIGAIWYFSRTNGIWTEQQKIVPNDPDPSNGIVQFGSSSSISWDGNIIVAGAPSDASKTGAAWIFQNVPIEICPNSNKTFTSNVLGNNYQWQVNANDGNGFVNISNNANYTGVTMLNLQLSNIPSSWNGYKYRCVLNGGAKYSSIITLKISSYWNGTIDNKWETAGNWSCGIVPDKYTDVYINAGKPRYPVVTTNGIAECKSLTVAPGTSFNVNATKSIKIYGH